MQEALLAADLVMPSLDTGSEKMFRRVNRPHRSIRYDQVVDGLREFTQRFPGAVHLEVLLVHGFTDTESEVRQIAAHANRIRPRLVQLNTATRPTAVKNAIPADEASLARFARFFDVSAEVIAQFAPAPVADRAPEAVHEQEVLALLERRPCTIRDVSTGLGIGEVEATKRLAELVHCGLIRTSRRLGRLYFSPSRERSGPQHEREV